MITRSFMNQARFLRSIFRELRSRWLAEYRHPILINSIPKCGTNMLANLVWCISDQFVRSTDLSKASEHRNEGQWWPYLEQKMGKAVPSHLYLGHVPFDHATGDWLRSKGYKHLFMYRDPRDYAVSQWRYIMEVRSWKDHFTELLARLPDDSSRLSACIRGVGPGSRRLEFSPTSFPSVQVLYDAFMPWQAEPEVFSMRYESFIGPDGPNVDSARETVGAMLDYLGISRTREEIDQIIEQGLDSKSPTRRKGKSGGWKEEFGPEHVADFREVADGLVEELGYPPFPN